MQSGAARTTRLDVVFRHRRSVFVVLLLFAASSIIVMTRTTSLILSSTAKGTGSGRRRSTVSERSPISDSYPAYVRQWYDDEAAADQPAERRRRRGADRRRHATFVALSASFSSNASRLAELLIAVSSDDCRRSKTTIGDAAFRGYQLYAIGMRGDVTAAATSDVEQLVAASMRRNNCSSDVVVSVRAVGQLVTALNGAALDAYVDRESDQFRLVFAFETTSTATGTQLAAAVDAGRFDDPRRSPGLIGTVIDYTEVEVVVGNNSVTLSSVFFEAEHMEIFGWMLPPGASSLQSAVGLLLVIYDERNLTVNSTVMRELRASESWSRKFLSAVNSSGPLFVELRDTIDRYLTARQHSPCWRWRCQPTSAATRQKSEVGPAPVNVVSMSLYGASRRYTIGAIRNAQLQPVTFPGWRLRIYCELPAAPDGRTKYPAVPAAVLRRLVRLGAELHPVNTSDGAETCRLAPMLWRFLVAVDQRVDAFIVRDSDSRLTPRDSTVVNDWLHGRPSAAFHCIRDHPSHGGHAVSGGLWGGRPRALAAALNNVSGGGFKAAMMPYSADYMADMTFLGRDVWPRVQSVAYCHDSVSCDRYGASFPFPVARRGDEHLGQVYDEFTNGRWDDVNKLRQTPVNKKCVPL